MEKCIFVDKPKECYICDKSRKLNCLRHHMHLKVTEEGKKELHDILEEECTTPRRYKELSGEAGRKR